MAVASGDRLWRLYSDRSFDDIIGSKDVLDELREYLFFEPLPFVRRVVFMATPHGGSELSRSVVGRVSSNLISDSDHIHKLLYGLVKENPDAFDSRRFRRFPTSIENARHGLADIEGASEHAPPAPPAGAHFHSIIGSLRPTGTDQTTDGVVPYRSAHLDGVESERLVRSGHGVQQDPEAIREVRRILRLHIGITTPNPGAPEAKGPKQGATAALDSVSPVR